MEGARDRSRARTRGSRARAPRRCPRARRQEAAGRCRARRRAGPRGRGARAPAGSPPTPGSTTARWTPTGMYGSVFASTSAPCSTACGGMPCVTSMIWASGAIRLITPWQVPTKSSCSPKSVRKEMNTRPSLRRGRVARSDGRDEPVDVVASPPRATTRALPRGQPRASSPGRSRPRASPSEPRREREPPTARRARPGRRPAVSRAQRARPVERHEVGVELVHEQPARALGPANSTRPAGRGSSASSPSCVETVRDEIGAAERVRRRGPIAATAQRAGRASAGAARARRSRS